MTFDAVANDPAFDGARKLLEVHQFRLAGIPTWITIALFRELAGKVVFETSHRIKTPMQKYHLPWDDDRYVRLEVPPEVARYRTQTPCDGKLSGGSTPYREGTQDEKAAALERAVAAFRDSYNEAVNTGKRPHDGWLEPNTYFSLRYSQ